MQIKFLFRIRKLVSILIFQHLLQSLLIYGNNVGQKYEE